MHGILSRNREMDRKTIEERDNRRQFFVYDCELCFIVKMPIMQWECNFCRNISTNLFLVLSTCPITVIRGFRKHLINFVVCATKVHRGFSIYSQLWCQLDRHYFAGRHQSEKLENRKNFHFLEMLFLGSLAFRVETPSRSRSHPVDINRGDTFKTPRTSVVGHLECK